MNSRNALKDTKDSFNNESNLAQANITSPYISIGNNKKNNQTEMKQGNDLNQQSTVSFMPAINNKDRGSLKMVTSHGYIGRQ